MQWIQAYSRLTPWLAGAGLSLCLAACGSSNQALEATGGCFTGLLPAPGSLARQVSAVSYSTAQGIDYQPVPPPQNLTDNGNVVILSPSWDSTASPAYNDLAYALYAFDVTGFFGAPELRAGWNVDPGANTCWIGVANFNTGTWDWFAYAPNTTVSLPSLSQYTSTSDTLLAVVLLAGTSPAQLAWLRLGGAGVDGQVEVRIPSPDSCGAGGELQLRIFAPAADATHFPEGAPVCVDVPGGLSAPTIDQAVPAPLAGFGYVSWNAPGIGAPGLDSDGAFDDRGPLTIAALRDVTRYALGELADSDGLTFQERLACNVLYNNVGLAPMSNGGPLCWSMLATHGAQVDSLAWVMGWENPTNSQVIMAETGRGHNVVSLPGDGEVDQTGYVNDQYSAWGAASLTVDYSNIAYDPIIDMLYLERGGLVRFDLAADTGGARTSDINGDGLISPAEDWGLGSWTVDEGLPTEKRYYSLEAVQACYDYLWTPSTEPSWLPTMAEAQAFWEPRDATFHFADVAANLPSLNVIICGSEQDHVQTAPDYPHLHQSFSGLLSAGINVKIGPGASWVELLRPDAAGHPGLPNYNWNTEPADWLTADYVLPEIFDTGNVLMGACIYELADMARP